MKRQGLEPALAGWRLCRLLACALALAFLAGFTSGCASDVEPAHELETQGDLAGAVELYRGLLEEEPHDLPVLRALALDLLLLQRYDEAVPIQEKVVSLDPEDALTRVELAFNYLNHQSRPDRAVLHLTQAVELEPTAKNWTFLAQAQSEAGDEAAAEHSLGQAIEADPAYPYAYSILLKLLDSQGRSEEALELRQTAAQNGVEIREE